MPFALAIIGIAIFVTAVKGTSSHLFGLVKGDLTGQGNFIYWVISILFIGALGYIKRIQPIVNMFLVLMMVSLFLAKGNRGFFGQFMATIKNPATNCDSGGSKSSGSSLADSLGSLNPTGTNASNITSPLPSISSPNFIDQMMYQH